MSLHQNPPTQKNAAQKDNLSCAAFIFCLSFSKLLQFSNSAGFSKLCLESFSLILSNAFLNRFGSALNHILCLFQAKTGDLANCLDNSQLIRANLFENNVKLGLLFLSGSSGSATGNSDGSSSGGNA